MVGDSKWLCVGDFNSYKSAEDKHGSVNLNLKSMHDFNKCCFDCGLIDVNFCGPRYTWKNRKVQERLDWALRIIDGSPISRMATFNT